MKIFYRIVAVFIAVVGLVLGIAGVGAGWAFIALGAGFYAVTYTKSFQAQQKKPFMVWIAETSKGRFIAHTYNIAGVTFANDDGISRQDILKELVGHEKKAKCSIVEYSYNGEQAFKVVVNGQTIGNIRRDDIPFLGSHYNKVISVTGLLIDNFINDYGEEIYRAEITVVYIAD